ncbi:hypothetical protein MJN85_30220, partial [Salmonella enterica subsp. enterica serovar Anatum]|nr:hypothetical protein [Salmonella enterica subsp. enterica serovar Anatum]
PSKGVIRDDFDPARIASIYQHYASAISVLTDEKYFQGSFDFLEEEDRQLRLDWEELMDMIVLGQVERITARHGEVLQLRPKAAN